MRILFSDEDKKIIVESDSKEVTFFAYQPADIIPALHFFDAHPDLAQKEIKAERIKQPSEPLGDLKEEIYTPKLITDWMDNTFAYQDYHFVMSRILKTTL
ncbi:MAG: hypothetical protein AABX07_02600 [Nanoarchaeota archaeon]